MADELKPPVRLTTEKTKDAAREDVRRFIEELTPLLIKHGIQMEWAQVKRLGYIFNIEK